MYIFGCLLKTTVLKTKIKIVVSIAVIVMLSLSLNAQKRYRFEYGVGLGLSNYLGDIGGYSGNARAFVLDTRLEKTRWNPTAYVRYKFHPRLAVKGALNYVRIMGDDALSSNPGRHYRNLSFRNDIFDLEGTLQLLIIDKNKPMGIFRKFTNLYFAGYGFVGGGVYYSNPQTRIELPSENGERWVYLRRYRTEGQDQMYPLFNVCVPMGIGCTFTISRRLRAHRIGVEVNWRWTPSDYLDDVSGKGDNHGWLNSGPGSIYTKDQIALNNRNPELSTEMQPAGMPNNYGWHDNNKDGKNDNNNEYTRRGNYKDNDSFFTVTVTYGVVYKAHYTKSRGRRMRSVRF